MAFMKVAYPGDYAGISWLNAHVAGAPVIAEAGDAYYNWRSRVSMFTGLPTIINGIHEAEQRYGDEIDPTALCQQTRNPSACMARTHSRADDLRTLYDSPSIAQAWRVIHTYGVKYIYVGFAERECDAHHCYSRAALAKFSRMVGHGLQRVFHRPGQAACGYCGGGVAVGCCVRPGGLTRVCARRSGPEREWCSFLLVAVGMFQRRHAARRRASWSASRRALGRPVLVQR